MQVENCFWIVTRTLYGHTVSVSSLSLHVATGAGQHRFRTLNFLKAWREAGPVSLVISVTDSDVPGLDLPNSTNSAPLLCDSHVTPSLPKSPIAKAFCLCLTPPPPHQDTQTSFNILLRLSWGWWCTHGPTDLRTQKENYSGRTESYVRVIESHRACSNLILLMTKTDGAIHLQLCSK